jgi:hypothetical protein
MDPLITMTAMQIAGRKPTKPAKRTPVGRPNINTRYIKIGLPDGVAERIDFISGNRRAEYIRQTVINRLDQDEAALAAERKAERAERKARKGAGI